MPDKNSFHGYLPPQTELREIWRTCLFVLDANVLLELYRYAPDIREDVLSAFTAIKDRLWLPYQAALEYHENRVGVILEQEELYERAKQAAQKYQSQLEAEFDRMQLAKRHSAIDPRDFLARTKGLTEDFVQYVDGKHGERPNILEHDTVQQKISELLDGRLGTPPGSQHELDSIYEDGKQRYGMRRPPGYKDQGKGSMPGFWHRGLFYKREYGDLIIWKEILERAKSSDNISAVIFVTQDAKEDWWEIVEREGRPERRGPRRELREELRDFSGVPQFYMYSIDRFLVKANEYLETSVKKDSIGQARDIAETNRRGVPRVTREQVLMALHEFDRSHRTLAVWKSFPNPEHHWRHKYIILHEGRAYPVKQITSMASGIPTHLYSGGHTANLQMERLGFEISPAFSYLDDDESEGSDHDAVP